MYFILGLKKICKLKIDLLDVDKKFVLSVLPLMVLKIYIAWLFLYLYIEKKEVKQKLHIYHLRPSNRSKIW